MATGSASFPAALVSSTGTMGSHIGGSIKGGASLAPADLVSVSPAKKTGPISLFYSYRTRTTTPERPRRGVGFLETTGPHCLLA